MNVKRAVLTWLGSLVLWAGLLGVKWGVVLGLSILVHELAHAAVAVRFGCKVTAFDAWGLFAYVKFDKLKELSPFKRALVVLAGPASGIAVCVPLLVLWWGLGVGALAEACWQVALLNLINMAPVLVLDGGRVWCDLEAGSKALAAVHASVIGLWAVVCWVIPEMGMLLGFLLVWGTLGLLSHTETARENKYSCVQIVLYCAIVAALLGILRVTVNV